MASGVRTCEAQPVVYVGSDTHGTTHLLHLPFHVILFVLLLPTRTPPWALQQPGIQILAVHSSLIVHGESLVELF